MLVDMVNIDKVLINKHFMKGNIHIMAEKKSKKATELVYTENELAAIEKLKANKGTPLSAKELDIPVVVLTSIMKKSAKFPEDPKAVHIEKTDYDAKCPTCGADIHHKLYEMVD